MIIAVFSNKNVKYLVKGNYSHRSKATLREENTNYKTDHGNIF